MLQKLSRLAFGDVVIKIKFNDRFIFEFLPKNQSDKSVFIARYKIKPVVFNDFNIRIFLSGNNVFCKRFP